MTTYPANVPMSANLALTIPRPSARHSALKYVTDLSLKTNLSGPTPAAYVAVAGISRPYIANSANTTPYGPDAKSPTPRARHAHRDTISIAHRAANVAPANLRVPHARSIARPSSLSSVVPITSSAAPPQNPHSRPTAAASARASPPRPRPRPRSRVLDSARSIAVAARAPCIARAATDVASVAKHIRRASGAPVNRPTARMDDAEGRDAMRSDGECRRGGHTTTRARRGATTTATTATMTTATTTTGALRPPRAIARGARRATTTTTTTTRVEAAAAMRTATPRRARAMTTTRAAATEETYEYQAEVRRRRDDGADDGTRRRLAREASPRATEEPSRRRETRDRTLSRDERLTAAVPARAQVHRLMDLIVNSLYSNKDVFLRELVSNASDACDKLRFSALSDPNAMGGNEELRIKIKGDPEAKTLTIEDTGIGMNKEDLVSSLGTIARSGTAKFMEMLQSRSDGENLIGKFGVGFYSAFLVADKITVYSKAASGDDDKTWVWESEINASSYTVKESEEAIARGTKIVLHLKEGCEEFSTGEKLSSLVKTYSEFISFPIDVWAKTTKEKEVEDKASTDALKEAWEKKKIEAEAKGEEFTEPDAPTPVMKTEFEHVQELVVTANNDKPIWVRSPKRRRARRRITSSSNPRSKSSSTRSRTRISPWRATSNSAPSSSSRAWRRSSSRT